MKKLNLNIRIHQFVTLFSGLLLTSVCVTHFSKPVPDNAIVATNIKAEKFTAVKETPVNANKLANLHLFGIAKNERSLATSLVTINSKDAELTGKIVDPAKLPPSALNISIDGLFTHDDFSKGHAIISNAMGETHSYRVGDKIKSNVKLHSVYSNYVVVNNNNKLESLKLPELNTSKVDKQQARKRDALRKFSDRKRDS